MDPGMAHHRRIGSGSNETAELHGSRGLHVGPQTGRWACAWRPQLAPATARCRCIAVLALLGIAAALSSSYLFSLSPNQQAAHLNPQGNHRQADAPPTPSHGASAAVAPAAAAAATQSAPVRQGACEHQRLLWITGLDLRSLDGPMPRDEAAAQLTHLQVALASAHAAAPSLVPAVVLWGQSANATAPTTAPTATGNNTLLADAVASMLRSLGAVVVVGHMPPVAPLSPELPQRQASQPEADGDGGQPGTLRRTAQHGLPPADLAAVVADVVRQLAQRTAGAAVPGGQTLQQQGAYAGGHLEGLDLEYVLWTDADVLFGGDVTPCTLPRPAVWSIGPLDARQAHVAAAAPGPGRLQGPALLRVGAGATATTARSFFTPPGIAYVNVSAYSSLWRSKVAATEGAGGGGGAIEGAAKGGTWPQLADAAAPMGAAAAAAAAAVAALAAAAVPLPAALSSWPDWGLSTAMPVQPRASAEAGGDATRAAPAVLPAAAAAAAAAATGPPSGAALPTLMQVHLPRLHHALCALDQLSRSLELEPAGAGGSSSDGSGGSSRPGGPPPDAERVGAALDHCCPEGICHMDQDVRAEAAQRLAHAWSRDRGRLYRAEAVLYGRYWREALGRVAGSAQGALQRDASLVGKRILMVLHIINYTGAPLVVLNVAEALARAGARVEILALFGGSAHALAARLVPVHLLYASQVVRWAVEKQQLLRPGAAGAAAAAGQQAELQWVNPRAYDVVVANTVSLDHQLFGFWLRQQVAAYGPALTRRLVWWVHELPSDITSDPVVARLFRWGAFPVIFVGHVARSLWALPPSTYHQPPQGAGGAFPFAEEGEEEPPRRGGAAPAQPAQPAHWGVIHPIATDELMRNSELPEAARAALRAAFRARHKIEPGAFVVLFSGRLEAAKKGFRQIIQAADTACGELLARAAAGGAAAGQPAALCPVVLFVASDGALQRKQLALRSLPLANLRVVRAPARDVILQAYHASDVFVMNSRDEAFGRVTVEAMSSGLPVLGSYGGETRAIVAHNVTGLLHAHMDDVSRLSRNLLRMHPSTPGGAARARAMGAAGRDRFRRLYSADRQLAEWQRVLAGAAASGLEADRWEADRLLLAPLELAACGGGGGGGTRCAPLPPYLQPVLGLRGGGDDGGGMLVRYSQPMMPVWTRSDMRWNWTRHSNLDLGGSLELAAAAAAGRPASGIRLGGALYVLAAAAAAAAPGGTASGSSHRARMWRLELLPPGRWAEAARPPEGLGGDLGSIIPFEDRLLAVAGGLLADGSSCSRAAALYDATADAWRALPSLPEPLCGTTTVFSADGRTLHVLKGTVAEPTSANEGSQSPGPRNATARYSHLTLQLVAGGRAADGAAWRAEPPAPLEALVSHTAAVLLNNYASSTSGSAPEAVHFFGGCTPQQEDAQAGAQASAQPPTTGRPPCAHAAPALHECALGAAERPSYSFALPTPTLQNAATTSSSSGSSSGGGTWLAAAASPLPVPLLQPCATAVSGDVALVAGGAIGPSWLNGFVYAYHAPTRTATAVGYLPQGPLLAPVCAVWGGRLWVVGGIASRLPDSTACGAPSAQVWSSPLPAGLLV